MANGRDEPLRLESMNDSPFRPALEMALRSALDHLTGLETWRTVALFSWETPGDAVSGMNWQTEQRDLEIAVRTLAECLTAPD